MSTQVMSSALPRLARPAPRKRLRLEAFVMGGAIVALVILVVLPLLSLLVGSVKGEQGMSLDHFSEVLSGRLYLNALKNSLILALITINVGRTSATVSVCLAIRCRAPMSPCWRRPTLPRPTAPACPGPIPLSPARRRNRPQRGLVRGGE